MRGLTYQASPQLIDDLEGPHIFDRFNSHIIQEIFAMRGVATKSPSV